MSRYLQLAGALLLLRLAAGQDLGTYITVCPAAQPQHQTRASDNLQGIAGMSSVGKCYPAGSPTQGAGYAICPSNMFNALFSDTAAEFICVDTLSPTCNGGCPAATQCLGVATSTAAGASMYYFCGVQCDGNSFLCDNAGALKLGVDRVAYCTKASSQCAVCTNAAFLTNNGDGTMECSRPVQNFAAYQTGAVTTRRRRQLAEMKAEQTRREWKERGNCMEGSMACMVGGEVECIETKVDINSCGGCPGEEGVNCAELPGVALGGVTCSNGSCMIYACDDDFTLYNNQCHTPTSLSQVQWTTKHSLPNRTQMDKPTVQKRAVGLAITKKEQLRLPSWQTVVVVEEYSNPLPVKK